jgi:hypothetical protein
MRYAQRGGYTPAGQQRREGLRLEAAAADLDGLVRIVKRKLKKIQCRPHLIDGCLAAAGLAIEPW